MFHISLLQFIDIGIIESTYNFFINVQTADFVDLTEHGNFLIRALYVFLCVNSSRKCTVY